jgi:hypothetical protein
MHTITENGSVKEVLKAAGYSSATDAPTGTTAVDLGEPCALGAIITSYTDGTDALTSVSIEHSDDNSTWSTLDTGTDLADAVFTQDAFVVSAVKNIKRYVRMKFTLGGATGDNYISVGVVGLYALHSQ